MWIDTHAHLFDLNSDQLSYLVSETAGSSVGLIVSTAVNLISGKKVLDHCSSFPLIYGAIGISPFDIEVLDPDWELVLKSLLDNKKIIALGEIGLDSTNPKYPQLEKQIPFFEKQLDIAIGSKLPVIIHSRGIEERTADICKQTGVQNAVFHCFTGDYTAAKKIVDLGYYISFSGIITFKKAGIRTLLPRLPLDRILIETDSPYLAPVPLRGKTNSPLFIRFIGEEIARLLSINDVDLQILLRKNFNNCFKIDI
jgi:TatD DNase family protein